MILTADYHTHTIFSHGKGDIIDNAIAAKKLNLKEIGITDHGFSHPAFGLRNYKIPKMKELCAFSTKETGVKVLLGIESNIISEDGKVDLSYKKYDDFELFIAGLHKFVMFDFKTFFKLSLPDIIKSSKKNPIISDRLIKENTKTFINVIKNNPVDIISHLNYCCFADAVEVAKAARDYGTYIELNSKKVHLSDDELEKVALTGVRFVIDSDAHTPGRVGEISLVENMLKRVDISLNQIDNIDGKLPKFRFKAFKNR